VAGSNDKSLMERIVSLCKRRGFVFQSSEIYGGLSSCWDYGPLGVELKKNIKDFWWHSVVVSREDVVGMDAAIIMHPKVWEASGHVKHFHDPLIDCKNCKARFREGEAVFYFKCSVLFVDIVLPSEIKELSPIGNLLIRLLKKT